MVGQVSADIKQYLKLARELGEVNYEMKMVSRLVEKAQTELDYPTLNQLRPQMSVLLQKLGELQAKKVKLDSELNKIKPPFIKVIDRAENQVQQITSLLRDVMKGTVSISDLWKEFAANRAVISKLIKDLEKSREILKKIYANADEEVKFYLAEELKKVAKLEKTLKKIGQVTLLDPMIVIRYKKMIGAPAIIEPTNDTALVSEIYVDSDLKIYLEISREAPIDMATLESLYRDIGQDFQATDVNDFRGKLLKRMELRLGKRDLKPSLLMQFLELEGEKPFLSQETRAKLEPKYEVVGYVPLEKITDEAGQIRLNRNDIITRADNLVRCPSIRMLPEKAVGSILKLKGKKYKIIEQTFIPLVGRVIIGLQQDQNGEPVPDIKLLEKIIGYMAKKKELSSEQSSYLARAIKILRSKKRLEEVFWMMRILITKASIESPVEVTEGNALRPFHVFMFCLKNKIPLTYSDILSYYLYAVNTDYVEYAGKQLQPKFSVSPRPLTEIFDPKTLKILIGFECPEFLGLQTERQKLIILCAPPLTSELRASLEEKFGVSLEFANTVGHLIRGLIYYGKIKTASDYKNILDALNVRRIIYRELVSDFEENEELIIAHAFLFDLMKNGLQ